MPPQNISTHTTTIQPNNPSIATKTPPTDRERERERERENLDSTATELVACDDGGEGLWRMKSGKTRRKRGFE